jgi:radical SAM superfamily enzyme YgiQ (UPF0313 family)
MSPTAASIHAAWRRAEVGAPLPQTGQRRVCAVYPGRYNVAMANLGYQWLFYALAESGLAVGRLVQPEPEVEAEVARHGLTDIDADHPARATDAWFVSISFENDLATLAGLLRLAGLAPRAADRRAGDPLVIAGGVVPTLNPEPVSDLADVCLLGEGAAALAPFLARFLTVESANREDFLRGLADLPGAYVGRFYVSHFDDEGKLIAVEPRDGFPERIVAPKEKTVDPSQTRLHLRAPGAAFGDALLVETARGCIGRCRFCAAGHLFLPYRPADAPASLPDLGQTALGLVGSNVSGHPDLDAWIELAGTNRVTLSSIRRGSLRPAQWQRLVDGGLASAALAPEAGSERLRAVCNKPATDDEILAEVRLAADAHLRNFKLYFLVGLPTETSEDLQGIVALVGRCREIAMIGWKAKGRAGKIVVSLNPFVPKPQTPFQWLAFGDPRELERKLKFIKNELRGVANIEVQSESLRSATFQALLSTGDRRAGELARLVDQADGVRPALREWTVDWRTLLAQPRAIADALPWDRVDVGVKRSYLEREFEAALAGRVSPPCDFRRPCRLCGVC